ncbi:hypothetical protein HMPREF1624_02558 [Sporothrix schenckii ATCC 58251]|uniref:AMP-dependent synthetase/ligase domain-containing protein n=2 Tax=Sporothrix schenckii TaxID=29908 RepID=U7Q2S6_SPOS1|nr:hypothetical protein HMPREF1624_02558 [Sporothrix schenckii ATCC 58251]
MASPRVCSSPYLVPNIPSNLSFWQFILRHNIDDTVPDKVILQEHERPERQLTYGSAPKLAGLGADALRDVLGLTQGDTILIVGKNSLDYLQVEFAALWAGITAAFGSPTATVGDLVHFIDIVEPAVVFCDAGDVMALVSNAIDQAKWTGTRRPGVVGLGERGTAKLAFPSDFIDDTTKAYSPPMDLADVDNHSVPSVICFSSGTSGLPKGAVLSHRNLIAYLLVSRSTDPANASANQRDVFYAPLGHIYGVFTASLPLLTGGYVRLLRNYTLHDYVEACVDVRATTLRMVPPTLVAMVKDPFVRQQNLASVRTISCSGAVLAPDIISEVHKMLGTEANIVQGYGKMRFVDDDLKDVPDGQPGEILFTAPTVFMGYKKNPAANAEAFPFNDGWLRTGDVGRIDADGYVWLTDRKKDLIKYKGNQVTPAELENVLHSHPLVTEAGVCGAWDAVQETEVPVGYVNFKPTVSVADRPRVLQDVLAFANSKVARTKKLRGGLFYLETFPRNATGKLMRRSLPARLQATRNAKL